LASKISAYKGRGKDPRTSPDFEDIVYMLDNRKTFVKEILAAKVDVKSFLIKELENIIKNPNMHEAVQAHLEPAVQTQRFEMLITKLQDIVR
jgi:hypothetical protein